jgi:hypothetical protein
VQPGKGGFSVTPKGEQVDRPHAVASIEAFRHQSNGVAGRLIGEVRWAFPKQWINRCCCGGG